MLILSCYNNGILIKKYRFEYVLEEDLFKIFSMYDQTDINFHQIRGLHA